MATAAGESLPMARETDEMDVLFRCRTPEGKAWDAPSK
jgi:hypothetical protein